MTKNQRTCYRCSAPATTREHFPPRCFFPKGEGLNLQLKTVPSCKEHNNDKSSDDQYLLAHICMNASKGPSLARDRFVGSISPQLDRSPKFTLSIFEGATHFADGTGSYKVDIGRFNNFFNHLCWALYFDRYGHPFNESNHAINHTYPTLQTDDPGEFEVRAFLAGMIGEIRQNHPKQVFNYEAAKVDESVYSNDIVDPIRSDGSITIVHRFYGLFEAISMLSRKWPRIDA